MSPKPTVANTVTVKYSVSTRQLLAEVAGRNPTRDKYVPANSRKYWNARRAPDVGAGYVALMMERI
jgi:hypothetical protein